MADDSGGGEGEKPLPVKKTNLSPQQRRDWNDMLDQMQKDGVAGSKDLDQTDKSVGKSYIEKYKKENPDSTVHPDMIPDVVNEHKNLRSGDSYAGMSPEETRVLRKQMNGDYMKIDVPGSMGSALSRMYFPEFKKGDKNYGTDAGAYMKDFAKYEPSDTTRDKSIRKQYPNISNLHDSEFVDSVFEKNKGKNFVKRYLNPSGSPMIKNKDGSVSTLRMASSDNIAYPTIVQLPDGSLKQLNSDGPNNEAYKYAMQHKEYIEFDNEKDADWFANNGYKLGNQSKDGSSNNQNKSDYIPLPDYNDQKSRNEYLQKWEKKYGDLQGRGDTVLKLNEVPRGGSDTMKNISVKAAKEYGLDPALLYSSAMEEGASGLFKDKSGQDTKHRKPGEAGYEDYYGDKEYPISGGNSFGFQTFNQRFPDLVKGGYLPKDFASKFRNKDATIQEGKVESANDFKSVDDAMKAKAAMMKFGEDKVKDFAKEHDIKLSDKAKDFFTLAWFNGGEGGFEHRMKEYNDKGYLKGDKFLDKRPAEEESVKGTKDDVWGHVTPRIHMAKNLKEQNLFE